MSRHEKGWKVTDMRCIAEAIEGVLAGNRQRFAYLHVFMLIAFLVLTVMPAFLPMPQEDAGITGDFTLLAKTLIWGAWFPLMLFSVIIFGRLWCGLLCPQGALSEFAGNIGLNRPIPRWMRWGGVPILSFIAVTAFGQVVGVRDYPLPALLVLGGTMVMAMTVGFVYASRHRPWCRYLCPIGPLLGVFSRLGAVSLERDGGDGRGCVCPTFINTSTKASSAECIECFRCVSDDPAHSLRMKIRRPGLEIEEIRKREPSLWEVVFLFMATGLSLGAFHWQANPVYVRYRQALGGLFMDMGLDGLIGKSGPWWIMVNYREAGEVFNWLDFISIPSFMLGSMAVVALALFLLTLASALMLREDEGVTATIARLGYMYAPVAVVSLFIGLGLTLFQSMHAIGLGRAAVRSLQAALFAGGGVWSLYLAFRLQRRLTIALAPSALGIGFVLWAWRTVLF
jgi:hypothetical protein